MPAGVVFHVGNALALNCLHNDGSGLALALSCCLESISDLAEVVTVDVDDIEVECLELLVDGIDVADVCYSSVDLKVVVVYDNAEVIEVVRSREHGSFPDLAFLEFTVSKESIYSVVLVTELSGERHACCCGKTLTERSRAHVYAGSLVHAGMSLQVRAELSESLKVFNGEESSVGKCRIVSGRSVALGKNKSVAVFLTGILGIDVHLLKIQICVHIGGG